MGVSALTFFTPQPLYLMSTNRISVNIPAAVKQKVVEALSAALQEMAPYLYPLTPEQRQSMVKMGDKSLGFMQDIVRHGNSTPVLVPSFVDFNTLKQNVQATSDLDDILNLLIKAATDVESTKMQTGSLAYADGLLVYNNTQTAAKANVPGAQAALEEMSKRFVSQGQRKAPAKPKSGA
jgi:hypothetical protein